MEHVAQLYGFLNQEFSMTLKGSKTMQSHSQFNFQKLDSYIDNQITTFVDGSDCKQVSTVQPGRDFFLLSIYDLIGI